MADSSEISPIISSTIFYFLYFFNLVNILCVFFFFTSVFFIFIFFYPNFCHVSSLDECGSNHCCSYHFLTHF